jgi:LEA14-like dessication related protein
MARLAAALLGLVLLASCSRPVPPTLAPKSVSVSSISATGLTLDVELAATNPNSISLSADGATAKVLIDGATPLGTATMTEHVALPADSTTTVHMPLAVSWDDLATFIGAAARGRDVPYTVSGSAAVGGVGIHVDVPFTINGTLTQAQIKKMMQAGAQGLPALPGLFGTPGGK